MNNKPHVVVGMSGGVDSSVAAYLLKEQGYQVTGLFMVNWDSAANQDVLGNPTLADETCPQEKDYSDALNVANHLNISLERVDFVEEYWNDVFTYFLDEYEKGRTPNPDVMCNKYIKFAKFKEHAKNLGADYIAMGHYARLHRHEDGRVTLLRGVDSNKDQTYFLSQLTQEQLKDALFPVGDIPKDKVRAIAHEQNLPTADKKDSTGICFIGERDFQGFLRNYLPAQSGEIRTLEEKVIGEHVGLMHYTIGQRKGLGIGGHPDYANEPWFVVGKDLTNNILYAAQGYHHDKLYSTHCTVESLNLIDASHYKTLEGSALTAKFRYRQPDQPVHLDLSQELPVVRFDHPVRAVTPGQAVVLYDGDVCLGGGIIKHVYKDSERLPY